MCDRVGMCLCVLCNMRLYVCVPRWAMPLCMSVGPVCAALWENRTSDGLGGQLQLQVIVGKSAEGVYARLIGSEGGFVNWGAGWGEEPQLARRALSSW